MHRPSSRRSAAGLAAAGLAAALLLVLPACGTGSPKRPRLVVLYAACSVNKDFLAPYDPSRATTTPAFERFGNESLVFEKHMSEAGQSGIAFAAIFSGCHADRHGAYRHPTPLQPELYQITEAFRDAGYDTYFWSGQQMGSYPYGYGQGVSQEHAYMVSPRDPETYTANEPRFQAVLDRLNADPEYEAFVQINLTLSHSPYHLYAPPEVIQRFVQEHPDRHPGLPQEDFNRLVTLYATYRLPLQWNYDETLEKLRERPERDRAAELYARLLPPVRESQRALQAEYQPRLAAGGNLQALQREYERKVLETVAPAQAKVREAGLDPVLEADLVYLLEQSQPPGSLPSLREGDVPKLHRLLAFLYEVALYRLDGYFGRWLDSVERAGLLDESLIAFTADHGEVLGRDNARYKWTHGLQLAPEVLNVPWMIRAPSLGVEPGRYPHVTRSIDVFPTLAGLCGIRLPPGAPVEGLDLSEAVLGRTEPPDDLIAYSHTSTLGPNLLELFGGKDADGDGQAKGGALAPWNLVMDVIPTEDVQWCWVGARQRDTAAKRVWTGEGFRYELYDLASDPEERRDLFDPTNEEHARMARRLDEYYQRLLTGKYARTELSAEDLEHLEALGYIGGTTELERTSGGEDGR